MWRDPYGGRSWSGALFQGLMMLVFVAVGARFVGEMLAPVIPLLVIAAIIFLLMDWIWRSL